VPILKGNSFIKVILQNNPAYKLNDVVTKEQVYSLESMKKALKT
jgi:hypothetical protein